MTIDQDKLWKQILDFEIDDPDSSFTFTDRLCRENDWSMEYGLRTVLEYKKFIFLVCISSESQTPSDQVDQVWHLHLLYTRSYWISFCKNLLNKEIHHGPTKGAEQRGMFKDQYTSTLEFYKTIFSVDPPLDIWPSPEERISDIRFTRVNRNKVWLIPKKLFRK